MFCTSCGTKNAADSNFCRQCGGKFEKTSAAKISPDDFERALPEDEQTMSLLERAYSLRKSGDLDGALGLCEQSLRLRSDSTSTHSLLGQIYEEKGNRAAAIGEYERVLALNPGSIADRVKLDELRARENGSGEDAGRPHPRVLMSDSHRAPVFDASRFTSVGVTVGLLVLGGLVAMQFRPRPSAAPTLPDVRPANAFTTAAVPNAKTSDTSVTTADSAKTFGNMPAKPQTGPVSIAAPFAAGPIPVQNQNQVNPPVIYQVPQIRYVHDAAPAAVRNANVVSGSGKRVRTAGNNGGGTDDSRLILPGDPDVVENNGKITLKVGENDVPGKQTDKNTSKNNDKGDDANPVGMVARVEVDKSRSNGTRAVPSAPTGDARSLMVVGEDLKRGKDFRGAINAFTRSLASAGDQTGYVYQQLALCYQNLSDVSSAKSNYERAIDAYRKLEPHDPETARNGIRACQAGIKTFGN